MINRAAGGAGRAEEPHTGPGRMELQQMFVLVLSLAVSLRAHPCYNETDLETVANKKLQSHYYQHGFPNQASRVAHSCPKALYQGGKDLNDRSMSPWAYVEKKMPGHFPSTYYEARCLCEGCILYDDEDKPYESTSHNSAPLVMSRVFLKRELCEGSGEGAKRYRLKPVSVDVTVACTCVYPLYYDIQPSVG